MIPLDRITEVLTSHEPERLPDPPSVRDRAAVAMVFAGSRDALNLCFIERASRPGDRWSGQMAFPGGRASQEDPTPRHVAMRETHEEVGILLNEAAHIGDLSELPLHHHGSDRYGVLSPAVFYAGESLPSLYPEVSEVARAFWIPVSHLYDPGNRGEFLWELGGQQMAFPGIQYRDQIIWGLTWRVLSNFSELFDLELP